MWELSTGHRLCHFPPGDPERGIVGHVGEITCVIFFSDSRRLASCSDDRTIRVWDTVDNCQLFCLEGHALIVNSLSLSSDDRMLASCSNDLVVALWHIGDIPAGGTVEPTHRLIGHTGAITCCKIFKDNTLVISGRCLLNKKIKKLKGRM